MKLNINKREIIKPLQMVSGVVERRQTLPILSNVLMKMRDGSLTLTATDMQVELVAGIRIEGIEDGEITVPARKIYDICRSLPEDADISIEIKDSKMVMVSGKGRFKLATLPASDFPIVEQGIKKREIEFSGYAFKQMLEKTQFAMAQQDVRYYLNGLLMESRGNITRAVATDGHRLALCDVEVGGEKGGEKEQVIIPRKGVLEMSRIVGEEAGKVMLGMGSQFIEMQMEDVKLTSKLLDGKYPEYEKVIPREEQCGKTAYASREGLKESLSRASILANEKYRAVRMTIKEDKMKIMAHNPEQEEAEEEVEVEYRGEEVEIGFNVNYMIEAVTAVENRTVRMDFSDNNNSCLIRGKEEDGCEYVVMPMRL